MSKKPKYFVPYGANEDHLGWKIVKNWPYSKANIN